MYIRKLSSYNYSINIGTIIIRKINLIKILFLLLFLIISFISIIRFNNFLKYDYNNDILVEDFKTDISMLSETASALEAERKSNKYPEVNQFGSDGKLINANEIKPDLSAALIKIVDVNSDGKISNEEITELGIMRLKSDIFVKKLNEFQFNLKSYDHNLKNFIVITKGKYAGTILYNGPLKFMDDTHKQYFGIELVINARE